MNELLILFCFMVLVVGVTIGVVALIAFTCTVPVLTATSIVWLVVAGFIEFTRMMLDWVIHG